MVLAPKKWTTSFNVNFASNYTHEKKKVGYKMCEAKFGGAGSVIYVGVRVPGDRKSRKQCNEAASEAIRMPARPY